MMDNEALLKAMRLAIEEIHQGSPYLAICTLSDAIVAYEADSVRRAGEQREGL